MIGLAAFGVAVGYLGKKVLKLCGKNRILSRVVAIASSTVARIGGYFGGWVGSVVFGASSAAAVYYLGNKRVFY